MTSGQPTELTAVTFNQILAYVNDVEKSGGAFQKSLRIHFLRNFTIEPIAPYLKYYCYQAGIQPILSYSDYGNLRHALLDPESAIVTSSPDIIILSQYFDSCDLEAQTQDDTPELVALALEKTSATILVNTQIPDLWPHLVETGPESGGRPRFFEDVNRSVRSICDAHPARVILMDWERYIQRVGAQDALDSRYWYLNKAPLKKAFLSHYAIDIARVAKVLVGQVKKCLILDCDNTLWGGIVGEDGVSGIKLDKNEYPGKIFYDFHQIIIGLAHRGVMICLCSKNNEADVFEVLDQHPDCLIKRTHLSGFQINWEDKASNIRLLAERLNIGLDSMVFVDDSGIECDWVAKALPEVTVVQVPKDLSQLPALILKGQFFDTLTLSAEDKTRTLGYQQEQRRQDTAQQFADVEEYLASLALEVDIHECLPTEIARVAQLTQKTNQFNLRGRRYSEGDITRFVESDQHKVMVLWVKDRFGEYGLTGAAILAHTPEGVEMDTLLMSCRILSRRIEFAFLTQCIDLTHRSWAVPTVAVPFVPTAKNAQVKQFLDAVGCVFEDREGVAWGLITGLPNTPKIQFIQFKEMGR